MPASTPSTPGRPRSDLNATVFAATLRTVHDLGYANATMDRIAAAAGIAKTTIYRRWPSKGALITDTVIDAFGPAVTPDGATREEIVSWLVRLIVTKVGEPGVGAAFAGVFVDAMSDPGLRELLATRMQEPGRLVLQDLLGQPADRVLLLVDVIVGTVLHRMGITGAPMAEPDVAALTEMVLHLLR